MVDAPLRLLACVLPATALSQGRGYGSTSAATKTIVSGLTQLVNLNGGAKPANKKRPRRFASLTPQQVKAGLADDFRNEYLWSGRITPELYDEACVFTDPTLSFRGLDVFEANLRNLDPWIERFVPSERRRVDLYALAVDGAAITASWRMVGTLALPWRPRLDLNGTTTYTLNGAGAPSAFVTNPGPRPNLFLRRRRPHFLLRRDVGALGGRGPVAALDTGAPGSRGNRRAGVLARPARGPGADPEGARAARESADGRGPAGSGAGAFVRYEFAPTAPRAGFGNDAADYATPLGLPEETGLAAALGRRGFRVEVVPVARGDWLQVLTRGARDPDFLLFEKARRTSPAFRWYADKVSETLGKVDGPVLLVGHSAGGWLAKLACLLDGAVAARTVGVVTLGAPHVPPPEGTPCATRGVLADVAGAAWPDVALITVASDAIRGDRGGDVEAATAADAYGRVSGNPEGLGDSVVPLSAAHLPEADLQLTLPCRHSINVAGTSVPTDDWYGAERWVDAWLGPALDVVSKPRWLRKLVRR